MRLRAVFFGLLFGLILPGIPSFAHHSVAAEFDLNKRVTLQGRITKIEWTNPHVYLYLDVESGGKTATWACEAAGPNTLAHQGWRRTTLKVGDRVTVIGFMSRDGAHVASAREVLLADGRKMFVASPNDGVPRP
jgi:hypothetical protein